MSHFFLQTTVGYVLLTVLETLAVLVPDLI